MINGATINGAVINGAGTTGSVEMDFLESFDSASSLDFLRGITIVENSNIDATISDVGTFIFDLTNSLDYKNKIGTAFLFSLASSLNFTGNVTLDKQVAIAFLEAVLLADSSVVQSRSNFAIAEALVNTDDLSSGFALDFLTALGITDPTDFKFQAVFNLLESLNITADSEFQARLFFSPTEGIDIADDLSSKAIFSAVFQEGITIGGLINTPEGLFEAWVVNAETRSPFQYTNFPFNSFAMIGGNYYGADESGLFSLDGDTDDGTAIDASIKSGLINLGTTLFKNIPRAYFGYTSSGQLLFNTITTESGQKIERWYELKEKTAEDTTNARVKMARGVKSVYWQFEIINVDGADFDFDEIKLMPAILKRRR